jgi:hypothetical protein
MRNQDLLLLLVAEKMKPYPFPPTDAQIPEDPYIPLMLVA